jgi:hypothetical protein
VRESTKAKWHLTLYVFPWNSEHRSIFDRFRSAIDYCRAQALIAAVETAPPITQGRPSAIVPTAAAAMQPKPIAA